MKPINPKHAGILFRLAAAFFVITFAGSALMANQLSPEQVIVSTPDYEAAPANFDPRQGQYAYEVSWNGIPAGSASLEIQRRGGDFQIRTKARTLKLIDWIYKLRYISEGVVSADTLMPKKSIYISRENEKVKKTEVTFMPDGSIQSVRADHRGRVKRLDFETENLTLDPYSAAMLALSLDWKVGDTRRFDTFGGKSRYLVELTAVARESVNVNGTPREAIVIEPKVTKLTEPDSENKLQGALVYIAADSSREILKIVSDLLIGSLQTRLVAFTPAASRG